MFTISFTFASAEELQKQLGVLVEATSKDTPDQLALALEEHAAQREALAEDKPAKKPRAKRAEKKEESPVEEETPVEEESPVEEEAAKPTPRKGRASRPEINYEKDVKPKLIELATSVSREAAAGVVNSYGVKAGSEIPTDKLGEALAMIEKLIEAASDDDETF